MLNETHDPLLRSWVSSANTPETDFPIQNLPFGVFRRAGSTEVYRCGIAIGDQILDLSGALRQAALPLENDTVIAANAALVQQPSLNALMAAGPGLWSTLRRSLSRALRAGAREQAALQYWLVPAAGAQYALPARIGDYTDFYASIHHARAVGRLFRRDNPLLPNYRWVPIGYHGRSSSITVSGQPFHRPLGQRPPGEAAAPTVGPSERIDFELELGIFIGVGNAAGTRIAVGEAGAHVFGLCLLNDWSARDLQLWEGQPLGPFLSKNFATTLSPWIITWEALAPYRVPWTRSAEDPPPLPYLDDPALRHDGALDIELGVYLQTESMLHRGEHPVQLSRTNFRHSYWTVAQLLAHHTINGCNLEPGDLLGSGTQSGPLPQEAGSLLELTQGGRQALTLPDGECRSFLADGDTVSLRGWCARAGIARLGFGEATAQLLPALVW